jgi:hypothetical protein
MGKNEMWSMFSIETLPRWIRAGKVVVCLILAIYVTYKGQAYPGPSMMPPVMCALTALMLGLTGLAIGCRNEQSDWSDRM